jgi:hypothetical protein
MRQDPIGHSDRRAGLSRVHPGHELSAILTKIARSFGVSASDLSQNGNWIRIMYDMESFRRPAGNVPRSALTLPSTFSDDPSTKARWESDIIIATQHKQNVQTSLSINSPCAGGLDSDQEFTQSTWRDRWIRIGKGAALDGEAQAASRRGRV